MSQRVAIEIRRADEQDAEGIAAAHVDSIHSIGPGYYDATIVRDWSARVAPGLYVKAMAQGEHFFIATDANDPAGLVLGFSSSYRIDGTEHGVGVYVRGAAARRGVGSALLRRAEADAI